MFVQRQIFTVVGMFLLISLVCSVSTDAKGGLPTRLSSKLHGHVSTLSRSFVAGVFTLATLCSGQVCLPQAMAAAEQASSKSIVQNAEVGQVSPKVVKEARHKDLGYEREISTRLGNFGDEATDEAIDSTEELWLASYYGDLAKVKMLDSKFPYDDPNEYPLYEGEELVPILDEALTYAVIGGHLDVVGYLVAKGIPHSSFDLRLAVKHQHWDIVLFLAASGVRLDYAIEYAADIQSETALRHLRAAGADVKHLNRAMKHAAQSRKLDAVKFLHTHGADDLNKAMFVAADMGDFSIVKYLREQGADDINEALLHAVHRLDWPLTGGMTTSKWWANKKDIIKFLIDEGADNFAEATQTMVKSFIFHDARDVLDLLIENQNLSESE